MPGDWCAFCVDSDSATCLKRGVSEAQLAVLAEFDTSPLFDARPKAALACRSMGDRAGWRTARES